MPEVFPVDTTDEALFAGTCEGFYLSMKRAQVVQQLALLAGGLFSPINVVARGVYVVLVLPLPCCSCPCISFSASVAN
jgi:hypothetical protein